MDDVYFMCVILWGLSGREEGKKNNDMNKG